MSGDFMKFKGDGMRAGVLRALGAMVAALLLASCGGGEQVDPFVPNRVLAFGDENSRIESNGDKYTVNYWDAAATTPARDCTRNPIWIQSLASAYALSFPECTVANTVANGKIRAAVGATSRDVKAQIETFVASDSFGSKDLVTVLVGTHDILEQYALIGAAYTEAQASAVLAQRGIDLAGQVNFIARAGGKVLIATTQDMGLTPFAVKEEAAHPGEGRPAVLTRLTASFNTKLRINLINDGHMIGLLLFDEQIQAIAKSGWIIDKGACLVVPSATDCDSRTTITDSRIIAPATPTTSATWLWADDTHMSFGGHGALGSLALARAQGNPF
jgi:outer membrane lipase/esterase